MGGLWARERERDLGTVRSMEGAKEWGADGRQEEGRACDFRGLVVSPLFPRFIVPFFLE